MGLIPLILFLVFEIFYLLIVICLGIPCVFLSEHTVEGF